MPSYGVTVNKTSEERSEIELVRDVLMRENLILGGKGLSYQVVSSHSHVWILQKLLRN